MVYMYTYLLPIIPQTHKEALFHSPTMASHTVEQIEVKKANVLSVNYERASTQDITG